MKLILRNQIIRSVQAESVSQTKTPRTLIAIALAGVVTGVNYYFQNFVTNSQNERQKQLIDRVSNDQVATDFLNQFNYHNTDDWQCKKITLDGNLKEGRFLVKRNRGNQQGYIVLAPFTVQRDKAITSKRRVQRKFVLNMGWIPKHSKHLIKTITAADTIGENQYTAENRIQAMQKQAQDQLLRDPRNLSQMTTITTVEAYIRRGQQRQILNGLNNWKDQKFYKFIDLAWLTRLFRISNSAQAETIYLERVPKTQQQTEVVPIPTNKQHVIDDLKERIEFNNKNKDRNITAVGVGSVISAVLLSVI